MTTKSFLPNHTSSSRSEGVSRRVRDEVGEETEEKILCFLALKSLKTGRGLARANWPREPADAHKDTLCDLYREPAALSAAEPSFAPHRRSLSS